MERLTVEHLLRASRLRLARLEPSQAHELLHAGACMIDVRTAEQIGKGGRVPGALELSLNVLEWRVDPTSSSRHVAAPSLADTIIILCDEGYCSSLAAARLQDLGFHRATDVIGGFRAWQEQGMPVRPSLKRHAGGRASFALRIRPRRTT